MAIIKTTTLTLSYRAQPERSDSYCCVREHHSIANRVEVLFRDYCVNNGISIKSHNKQRRPK
ncbi:hypothetical protein E3U44_17520 [Nitrosococcus wardiae]|uniref:Transposase n=1 Tax=Nitrosococcus wardiae TaxID=1814290 RepID=A0A4P7C0K5_9GAMM|nr:hypothetical protein E3U44_17520 [Nitrosococcus wardiae]